MRKIRKQTISRPHVIHCDDSLNLQKQLIMNNKSLTPELLEIIEASRREAHRLGRAEVRSGCLLLGLLSKDNRACDILNKLGVSHPEASTRIAEYTTDENLAAAGYDSAMTADEPGLSKECQRLLRIAALEARRLGAEVASSEHLLLGMLHDNENKAGRFLHDNGVTYRHILEALNIRPSVRSGFGLADEEPLPPGSGKSMSGPSSSIGSKHNERESNTPVIDNFGVDLTRKAEEGILDPVVGRETETLRMAQIMCRRKKNNPILIGQPGVGKSAVVEGLAQMIVSRKAPHALLGKRIVALDMATVVAGTQFRGQFEERLRKLIEELKVHPEIVLFIDEIHTIIGAGSAAGTLDAANILKPALARGEVQCIGATTIDEYRKTIEKDGALERRFQKVMLEPSSMEETRCILENLKSRYEEHHSVKYTKEALDACVALTTRYVTDRCLPDKAIDAMDEAGSRVHLSSVSVPKSITEKEKEISALKVHKTEAAQQQNYELAAKLRDIIAEKQTELEEMNKAWLASLNVDCGTVDTDQVAEVVAMMSGVPAGRIAQNENDRLRGMKDALKSRVIAQDEAIDKLVRAITMSRLGMKGDDRPIGTFMFVGSTGVGKTHLVKCLAEHMFGRKDALIRIDMSEYGEKYNTSRLVGAPPGYVGYEEGGQLTERVRRHPYSVILLDEIEKAHQDVFNTLLQVMDEGRMTDGNGTTVDFRNTVIIMTSNSGTRQLDEFGSGIGFTASDLSSNKADGIISKALKRQFAPEFLNRLDDIIMFHSLTKDDASQIAKIELDSLVLRMEKIGYTLHLTPEIIQFIVDHGFDPQYGARSLKRAIKNHIEDIICEAIMDGKIKNNRIIFEQTKVKLQIIQE